MATPRARGGVSLTTLPPIRRSPLVCCSSPQMMRRNVVLPQPEGPSSTMNSPSGMVSEIPLTAGTSPNFLTMSRVNTADIEPPSLQSKKLCPPFHGGMLFQVAPLEPPSHNAGVCPGRARGAARFFMRSGLAGPFLEDGLALLRGPFDRVLGVQLARRGLCHHVVDDELVVDLVHRRRRRPGVAGNGGPLVRVLKDLQLVRRVRCRVVAENG